jgi:hypothetical protein
VEPIGTVPTWPKFISRCLALTFEAALDSVAGAAALGVKRRAIRALEIGMDQSDIIKDIQKPDTGRLEGKHAFPLNHVPEPRMHSGFLNQIDVTIASSHMQTPCPPLISPSRRNASEDRV